MSIINDIQNSHETLKSFLYSLILLPFWYVNIYFFHYEFYQQNEFVLIMALCICLHIASVLLFGAILFGNTSRKITVEGNFAIITVVLFIWFMIIDAIAYTIKFFNGKVMYFFTFLCFFFAPLALGAFISTFKSVFQKNNQS